MLPLSSKLGFMLTLIACACLYDSKSMAATKQTIKVGAIFPEYLTISQIAFQGAIKRANYFANKIQLKPIIRNVPEMDSLKAERAACELLSEGVHAIFGPSSNVTSGIVDSICNKFQIPHIMTHWTGDTLDYRRQQLRNLSINVYPDSDKLAEALADIIKDYSWKTYTIVYDTDENLIRLKNVIGLHGPKDLPISVEQLDIASREYRPQLKKIHKSTEPHIILSVETHRILDVFTQAHSLHMLDDEYLRCFIVSLDAHTIDLSRAFGTIVSNITSVRLIDMHSAELDNYIINLRQEDKDLRHITYLTESEYRKQISVESALFYDAVQLFSRVYDRVYGKALAPRLNCSDRKIWNEGLQLASLVKLHEEVDGVTGVMRLDASTGKRIGFKLDIIELFQKRNGKNVEESGYRTIATWDEVQRVSYTRTEDELERERVSTIKDKVFVVVSRLGEPFLMRVENNDTTLTGNDRFEGYSKDLMDAVSMNITDFKYKIELVPDEKYGSYNPKTRKWDGLIKHLLDRKADFAICDLTITHERRTAVDFTMPFMTLGISILYTTPRKDPPGLFSFLKPFSNDVWICTAAAYLGVSVLICGLARLADREWESAHPCRKDTEERENIWGMLNSTWLSMGSVMGQGSDILPKAISTRLVAGLWYFFALIMLASYTANLAAFLTMEGMEATIKSVEDLPQQTKIKYGVVEGGSTAAFFQKSNHSTYKLIWEKMKTAQPSVFTKNNDEGKERVLNRNNPYAFFMESSMLEYYTEQSCNLTQVGGLLDSKGYGIAMPRDSPYRGEINRAILNLQERGELGKIKKKWWSAKKANCSDKHKVASSGAAELGVDNVGGVFLLVGVGIFVGFLIAICEFLWNVRRIAVHERMTPGEALKREIIFALKIHIRTKPVQYLNSGSDETPLNQSQKSLTASE